MAADGRASDLYGLPLEEFTSARNALASELTRAGDKYEAATVRALRKPSVPAWAVDQVARADPDGITELFRAGEALRKAQRKLVTSGDSEAVKEASRAERAVVGRLVARAAEILREAGHNANDATLERVADTFYATAVDEEARELVGSGTLTKELKRVGFGDMSGLSLVPESKGTATEPTTTAGARKERTRLESEAGSSRKAAEEAERTADDAEAAAGDAARAAEDARGKADAAREQARFARRAAIEARREADKAARRLERG
ncbi:MAG: hypothetical protein ACXVQY_02905 [Actinomycetota bacterium]